MKKGLCILLAVVIAFCLSGCNWNTSEPQTEGNDGRMTLVYNDGWALIYRDNETGVQYLRSGHGITFMVNTDGTPYTGETK